MSAAGFAGALNEMGRAWLEYQWVLAVQVGLLLLVVGGLDWCLRGRVRAAVRGALWMLIPVKLLLPAGLALPGSAAYWLVPAAPAVSAAPGRGMDRMTGGTGRPEIRTGLAVPAPRDVPGTAAGSGQAALDWRGGLLVGWCAGSLLLLGAVVRGSWRVRGWIARAIEPDSRVRGIAESCRSELGIRRRVGVVVSGEGAGPALCGFLRPVIVLPGRLVEELADDGLRHVFLHELSHLRRRDPVWSHVQTLLLVVNWPNPCVWIADRAARKWRELATDEAVVVVVGGDPTGYASTLLEVARHSMRLGRLAMGFLGIQSGATELGQRVRRLMTLPMPGKAGMDWGSWAWIAVVGWVLLPMSGRAKEERVVGGVGAASGWNWSTNRAGTLVLELGPGDPGAGWLEPVRARLREWREASPDGRLLISATRSVRHATLATVLGAATAEGVTSVSVRVVSREGGVVPAGDLGVPPTPVPAGTDAKELHTRSFRLGAAEGIAAALDRIGSGTTNRTDTLQIRMRAFMGAAGFRAGEFPGERGTAMFYNDRAGMLLVRGTGRDMALVERALEVLGLQNPGMVEMDGWVAMIPRGPLKPEVRELLEAARASALPLKSAVARRLREWLRGEGARISALPRTTSLDGRESQLAVAGSEPPGGGAGTGALPVEAMTRLRITSHRLAEERRREVEVRMEFPSAGTSGGEAGAGKWRGPGTRAEVRDGDAVLVRWEGPDGASGQRSGVEQVAVVSVWAVDPAGNRVYEEVGKP